MSRDNFVCPACGHFMFIKNTKMEVEETGRIIADRFSCTSSGQTIVPHSHDISTSFFICVACNKEYQQVGRKILPLKKHMVLRVNTYDENTWDTADFAEKSLDQKGIDRINKLALGAKLLDVYKVTEFNAICDFLVEDYDCVAPAGNKTPTKPFESRMECCTLNVTSNSFYWSGYYKFSNIRWETTSISLSELDSMDSIDEREDVEKAIVATTGISNQCSIGENLYYCYEIDSTGDITCLWADTSESNRDERFLQELSLYPETIETYTTGTCKAASIEAALELIRAGKWDSYTQML